jgi:hypothetical protein
VKFVLFVEGHTEKYGVPAFLKRYLDPRIKQPVGIKPVRFDGWAELVKDAPRKSRMYLNDPKHKGDILAIFALIDLHGPTIYPTDKKTAYSRYSWAKAHLERAVGLEKFHQFFAVHEIEAWLLSDPNLFPLPVKRALQGIANSPEQVNFAEPPKKLLQRLYLEKARQTYKNVTHGEQLFRTLQPELAYRKCPKLKALLDKMLTLAQEAGLYHSITGFR